jgi:hypothetical protein
VDLLYGWGKPPKQEQRRSALEIFQMILPSKQLLLAKKSGVGIGDRIYGDRSGHGHTVMAWLAIDADLGN